MRGVSGWAGNACAALRGVSGWAGNTCAALRGVSGWAGNPRAAASRPHGSGREALRARAGLAGMRLRCLSGLNPSRNNCIVQTGLFVFDNFNREAR